MGDIIPLRRQPQQLGDRLLMFLDSSSAGRPPVEFLRDLVADFGDPAPGLAELALTSTDPEVRLNALLMFTLAGFEPSVPASVRSRFAEAALPIWGRALQSRTLDEKTRAMVAPLFDLLGGDPELGGRWSSEGTSRGEALVAADWMPGRSATGWKGVDEVLRELRVVRDSRFDLPRAGRERIASALGAAVRELEAVPGPGSVVACVAVAAAVEAGVDPRASLECLERVAASGTPEAAWYMGELGRWPCGGEVFERASRLASDLRDRGIAPRSLDPGRFVQAVATAVDGAGARTMTLAREVPGCGPIGINLLLSETRGILDVWAEYEGVERMATALEITGIPLAPVGLEMARSLAGDALHRHRASGLPVPADFLLHRPLLGADPLEERPHAPDPRIPAAEAASRKPAVGSGTGRLADMAFFETFWFSSPAVYAFVRRRREAADLGPARRLRVTPALLREFHGDVLPGERAGLLRLVEHFLEIESLAGREGDLVTRLAREVRRALVAPGTAMEEIPYVRVLARRGLECADAHLRDGFGSQEEANEAGLDLEEEVDDDLAETMNEVLWNLPDPSPPEEASPDRGPPHPRHRRPR